jgi:hypothetical protein
MCLIPSLYCQTLEETQDWIKENLFRYRFSKGNLVTNNLIRFNDGYMVIHHFRSDISDNSVSSNSIIYKVPVRYLETITYNLESEKFIQIRFSSYDSDNLIEVSSYNFSKKKMDVKTCYKIEIELSTEFLNDNMMERMTRAFDHLIKLYGGKAIRRFA